MNDYISKPIDDKLLYSKIIKYLKNSEYNQSRPEEPTIRPALTCVNFEYLQRITKSNSRMIQLIELYLQEIPLLVQTMKRAIDNKDWATLKIATHSIIPTFSTMGINPEFEEVAKSIQARAVSLIEADRGRVVNDETMTFLRAEHRKIETVCAQAAEELDEKLRIMDLPRRS